MIGIILCDISIIITTDFFQFDSSISHDLVTQRTGFSIILKRMPWKNILLVCGLELFSMLWFYLYKTFLVSLLLFGLLLLKNVQKGINCNRIWFQGVKRFLFSFFRLLTEDRWFSYEEIIKMKLKWCIIYTGKKIYW
jgi:hypothetical protein